MEQVVDNAGDLQGRRVCHVAIAVTGQNGQLAFEQIGDPREHGLIQFEDRAAGKVRIFLEPWATRAGVG